MHEILNEYRVPGTAADITYHDPLKACIRFVDGTYSEADIDLLRKGFEAFLSDGGGIPLERCLHLPNTHNGWRKLQRDHWLAKAAALIEADGSWSGALKLEEEWSKFISRGPWQAWRDEEKPPSHATALSEALFYATRLNRSQGLEAKQLDRIVGHVFKSKSR